MPEIPCDLGTTYWICPQNNFQLDLIVPTCNLILFTIKAVKATVTYHEFLKRTVNNLLQLQLCRILPEPEEGWFASALATTSLLHEVWKKAASHKLKFSGVAETTGLALHEIVAQLQRLRANPQRKREATKRSSAFACLPAQQTITN